MKRRHDGLARTSPHEHREFDAIPVKLALVEKFGSRQSGDRHGRSLLLREREGGRRIRLVVILDEANQLFLIWQIDV